MKAGHFVQSRATCPDHNIYVFTHSLKKGIGVEYVFGDKINEVIKGMLVYGICPVSTDATGTASEFQTVVPLYEILEITQEGIILEPLEGVTVDTLG